MTAGHEALARQSPSGASGPGKGGDGGVLDIGRATLHRLRWFNVAMGALHLASAVVMLALANGFELPVGAIQLQGPPGTPLADSTLGKVGDVRLAWGTAAFLLLSAVFHAIIAGPGYAAYRRELRHGRNRFRWVEYSLSATLMIVLIALVTGVVDLAALVAIAFANTSMILFGWIMEVVNTPGGRTWWTPFWFGCIAGAGPWVAIVAYLVYNVGSTDVGPPGFVYGILISIFVLFNSFALNQWLQYRRIGPWRRYEFGEAAYIVLSLTAKSALAWQIFANTLI